MKSSSNRKIFVPAEIVKNLKENLKEHFDREVRFLRTFDSADAFHRIFSIRRIVESEFQSEPKKRSALNSSFVSPIENRFFFNEKKSRANFSNDNRIEASTLVFTRFVVFSSVRCVVRVFYSTSHFARSSISILITNSVRTNVEIQTNTNDFFLHFPNRFSSTFSQLKQRDFSMYRNRQ